MLGKSGSGKSALLNVCGGLDAPDQGEVIIKGRSSKDFSAQDFDSYRNTYVGFIFQEYNILNEFTVEDNIALALELQGKPKDRELIDKLLAEVELEQFAKRKPNTLSGGQKQRVAIARALVKNPEVIMADEPTGALDSTTGKQVFDTLKKLSQTKLVIVVSHDREFAESYADRIIELKDGRVISDVVKSYMTASKVGKAYNVLGQDTILIPNGTQLTTKDLIEINDFLSHTERDVIISRSSKDNLNFKKIAKINDDNSQDSFAPISEQPRQRTYSKEDCTLLRSKLPLKHAVKIGASNIKAKPVRFTFTVLLSVLSFIMFGLFSCIMFFDSIKVNAYSLEKADTQYLQISKYYQITSSNYYTDEVFVNTYGAVTYLTPSDITALKEKYDIIPLYFSSQYGSSIKIANLQVPSDQSFYTDSAFGIADGNEVEYVIGKAPEDNEIAISQYLYDCIKAGTLRSADNTVITVQDGSIENLVLNVFNEYYKVSGVFKQQEIKSIYNANMSAQLKDEWNSALATDFYSYIAINRNTYTKIKNILNINANFDNASTSQLNVYMPDDEKPEIVCNNSKYTLYSSRYNKPHSLTYYNYLGNKVNGSIPKGTIVIDYSTYMYMVSDAINGANLSAGDDAAAAALSKALAALENYENNFSDIAYEQFESDYKAMSDFINKYTDFNPTVIISGSSYNVGGFTNSSAILMNELDYAEFKDNSIRLNYSVEEITTDYNPDDLSQAVYSGALIDINGKNGSQLESLLKDTTTPHGHSYYSYSNYMMNKISFYTSTVSFFSGVFLYLGIGLAILAMLLLFNFISVSVLNKKREIGILRAVGARGTDVFKIFLSEAAIIVAICSILSLIVTAILASVINGALSTEVGVSLSMFVFSGITVAMVVGIAVISAFIATFLPVFNASRKKPVETIRSY